MRPRWDALAQAMQRRTHNWAPHCLDCSGDTPEFRTVLAAVRMREIFMLPHGQRLGEPLSATEHAIIQDDNLSRDAARDLNFDRYGGIEG